MRKAYELGMRQLCSFFNIVQKKGGRGGQTHVKKKLHIRNVRVNFGRL